MKELDWRAAYLQALCRKNCIARFTSTWTQEMIRNFDEVKKQLTELANVINSYKSEAVQLRIVELVLGRGDDDSRGAEDSPPPRPAAKRAPRKAKSKGARAPRGGGSPERKASTRSRSRPGSRATLAKLHADGFFKKPKTLADIVTHAETNMALKFKQSDFSGPLARYVRDEKLKRVKNANNQYEYTQP